MTGPYEKPSIEAWLGDVQKHVLKYAPEILPTFSTCAEEAIFGRDFIAEDLTQLSNGASVLEVGAGSFLLSCQLVREGFNVIALEPGDKGFFHFIKLRELILKKAEALGCVPQILYQCAEELHMKECFDFAFSINVMEHVNDVKSVLANVGASLRHNANYHFTSPNYLFPYEPHFNIPTLLYSRKLTAKVFKNKIRYNNRISDPIGTWRSLNWISVLKVKKITNQLPDLNIRFNQQFLHKTLQRIAYDKQFAGRRSRWMRIGILALFKTRLNYLADIIPVFIQPCIDCVITRTNIQSAH